MQRMWCCQGVFTHCNAAAVKDSAAQARNRGEGADCADRVARPPQQCDALVQGAESQEPRQAAVRCPLTPVPGCLPSLPAHRAFVAMVLCFTNQHMSHMAKAASFEVRLNPSSPDAQGLRQREEGACAGEDWRGSGQLSMLPSSSQSRRCHWWSNWL